MGAITREQKRKFLDLSCSLSPENLYCDGEISMAQARRRFHTIRGMWDDLERQVGRRVSEDEVWKWSREDTTL